MNKFKIKNKSCSEKKNKKLKKKKNNMSTALIQMAQKAYCLSSKATYTKLGNSVVTSRNRVYITPQNSEGPFTAGQKIVFQWPSNSFMDPQTIRFEFQPNFTWLGSGTGLGFANTCVDWIRRITLKSGSTEIIDIDNYNAWVAFQYKTVVPWTYSCTSGSILDQFQTQPYAQSTSFGGFPMSGATPQTVQNNSLQYASHTFMNGIFQVLQYLPLSLINNLQLEIYLDTVNNALMRTGSSSAETYTISNLRIYYDQINFAPEFAQSITDEVKSQKSLYIPFYQIRCHEKTMPLNTSNVTFQIAERVQSLNQIFCIPTPAAATGDITQNTIGMFNPKFTWVQHQFRLNSIYFPTYPITSLTEMMQHNFLATNQYGDIDSGGILTTKNMSTLTASLPNDQWLNEFYAFDFEREKCPSLLSGYNTDAGATDIEFILQCTNNNTTAFTGNSDKRFMCFTLFDSTIAVNADGTVTTYR